MRRVSGSNPLSSTSKRATTHGSWLFCWTSGVLGTPPFRFYHLTAEMNSAYGNSALRFELTCHLARPPEGGFAGFVPFGRSPFGDCTCSGRMNRPCANKILLRKTFETPDFRRKTPHPRRWQLFPKTIPPKAPSTGGGSWRRKATEGDDRDTAHRREHSPYLFRWEEMRWK